MKKCFISKGDNSNPLEESFSLTMSNLEEKNIKHEKIILFLANTTGNVWHICENLANIFNSRKLDDEINADVSPCQAFDNDEWGVIYEN